MTEGSPAGHIFWFALPLLLGSFLQQLYNMVDSFVVGNFVGDSALAAVGVGFPVIFMFSSLFMGLSNGCTVIIAQNYGAGKMDRVRDAVDTTYSAFVWSAIPMTAASLLLVKPILALLRVDSRCYHDAWIYLIVVSAGLIGTIGYNLNAGVLNGLGNSRTTLLFLAIASVLNIILDLSLVLWCHLAVLGVAVGTIVSQAFSWIFGVYYINRHYPQIAIRPFNRKFDRKLFHQIMSVGLPAGIQMSLIALGSMVVMSKVNTFGQEFTAGFNVGNKLDSLAFLPAQSLAAAVTAYVGQNVGAQRWDRVRAGIRIAVIFSGAWSLLMTAVLMPFGTDLMRIFSSSPGVIRSGAVYLHCIMPFYLLFVTMFTLNAAMRGAGDSLFPMINVVISLILVRVPALYLLANHFGADKMYYGYGIGWVLGFAISVLYYFSGRWKRCGAMAEEQKPELAEESCISRKNGL